MFKVVDEPTFTHTVKAMVPIDGGFDQQDFKCTYRVLDTDEVEKFDLGTAKGSTAFLRRAVVKLDDLVGKEDVPVQWNDRVRDKLFALSYVRMPIARGYFEALNKAAAGN